MTVSANYYKFTQKQVPGVEADDVIGTLAVRSVGAGYKVSFQAIIGKKWKNITATCPEFSH